MHLIRSKVITAVLRIVCCFCLFKRQIKVLKNKLNEIPSVNQNLGLF